MFIALLVTGICFTYIMIGSAGFRFAMNKHLRGASHDSTKYCFTGYWCTEATKALWLHCIAWPLAIPISFGWMLGGIEEILSREARDEKRRARELAEAEHRVKVARHIEEENRILDKQLNNR